MVDQVRLPVDIEEGAKGGPGFKTLILTAASGHEQRVAQWTVRRGKWDIGYAVKSLDDINLLEAQFHCQLGRTHAFLFRDWKDYTVEDELIGAGDGIETTFQLIKTYRTYDDNDVEVRSYVRDITQPVSSTVDIEVNGALIDPGDYTLNAGGVLVFDSPVTDGHAIRWTGEFDNAVRWDIDDWPASVETLNFGHIRGLRIVEVLDE